MNPAAGPELRDIHLPPAPGWWPPAPGWWLLALVVLVAVLFLLRRLWRSVRHRRWLARVQAELARIADAHARGRAALDTAADVSHLLRRASLRIAPTAAALSGDAWLDFLDARWPPAEAARGPFRNGPGRVLVDAQYRRPSDDGAAGGDVAALLALARRWLAWTFREGAVHV